MYLAAESALESVERRLVVACEAAVVVLLLCSSNLSEINLCVEVQLKRYSR